MQNARQVHLIFIFMYSNGYLRTALGEYNTYFFLKSPHIHISVHDICMYESFYDISS